MSTFLLDMNLDHISASVFLQKTVFVLKRLAEDTLGISSGISAYPVQGGLSSITATPLSLIQLKLLDLICKVLTVWHPNTVHPQMDGTTFLILL